MKANESQHHQLGRPEVKEVIPDSFNNSFKEKAYTFCNKYAIITFIALIAAAAVIKPIIIIALVLILNIFQLNKVGF
jgi:hypothetical protein